MKRSNHNKFRHKFFLHIILVLALTGLELIGLRLRFLAWGGLLNNLVVTLLTIYGAFLLRDVTHILISNQNIRNSIYKLIFVITLVLLLP